MSELRFRVVESAFHAKAKEVTVPAERPSEYFGKYVFSREKMFKYLPSTVYARLVDAMDHGAALDRSVADEVASGMKRWAEELGVTHYTHWFQPLTEGTAEKHDAFVEHDGKGGMMEEFSGKLLVQQEPDASSFPNGGIRNTFEARGYSAWDPSSPVFVVDDTLCIPTVFIAYTGESLDYKAPLLKALRAVDKAAVEVCHYFDPSVKKVVSYLGWEQEYFLVDEGLYAARPDLLLTGRTLMGHEASKNQQLEDHYFGAIPTRVAAFMKDLEIQALELGIPVKTRHNEVAPNQFELAPIFEECNLAVDHNMLIMSLMRKVARTHGFRVLLHEKPFKGVNGSGKHNNWSLGTDTGVLLMAPGKTAEENLRFITFIVNTLMAVFRHNGLLKASIMSATNAHRLGANEAPPAIISSFLGTQLSRVLDHLEESTDEELVLLEGKHGMKLDIPQIPELLIDNTDRNRTSPFAFTGNRFEFRAVGSEANCASAMIALNAAVAEQLTDFKAAELLDAINTMSRIHVKCLLVVMDTEENMSDQLISAMHRSGLPIMLITSKYYPLLEFDCIHLDEYSGIIMGVQHLQKRGYQRIACISDRISLSRVTVFKQAMKLQGMKVDPQLICVGPERAESGGYLRTKELLSLENPPDAVFCCYDQMAIGAIHALRESGLRIPEDMAVMGFDNLTSSKYIEGGITTIANPYEDMLSVAVNILTKRTKNPQMSQQQIALRPNLVVRHTT